MTINYSKSIIYMVTELLNCLINVMITFCRKVQKKKVRKRYKTSLYLSTVASSSFEAVINLSILDLGYCSQILPGER